MQALPTRGTSKKFHGAVAQGESRLAHTLDFLAGKHCLVLDDEFLIAVAIAAAQLVIQMREDERKGSVWIAGGVERARQRDAVRPAGDGDDHTS